MKKDLEFLNSKYWLSNVENNEEKGEATKYGNMSGFKALSLRLYDQIDGNKTDSKKLLSKFD